MKNPFYDNIADEVLIERLRDGEAQITDYIMEKYKPLVRGKAQSMYILGGDAEDLIQEGMIGLFKAVRDYDAGRDAAFSTFADLCVTRQMYSAIEKANRRKHIPLNNYVSLYERVSTGDDGWGEPLQDTLIAEDGRTPEEEVIAREEQALIRDTIDAVLSEFERRALDLWMTGLSCTEIARILSRDPKSTDNALTRAKAKLRRQLSGG